MEPNGNAWEMETVMTRIVDIICLETLESRDKGEGDTMKNKGKRKINCQR